MRKTALLMCYLLNFEVTTLRGRPASTEAITATAVAHGLYLVADGALWRVVRGGCSCDYVRPDGRMVCILPFLLDLLQLEGVKSVEVCWSWGLWNVSPRKVTRLPVEEFASANHAGALEVGGWYRLYDPTRFQFHNG